MTAPAPEKPAPIPDDIVLIAGVIVNRVSHSLSVDQCDRLFGDISKALAADRASQEERIREDERDRLYEEAVRRMSEPDFLDDNEAAFVQRFLSRLGAMQPIDRARQRGDAS